MCRNDGKYLHMCSSTSMCSCTSMYEYVVRLRRSAQLSAVSVSVLAPGVRVASRLQNRDIYGAQNALPPAGPRMATAVRATNRRLMAHVAAAAELSRRRRRPDDVRSRPGDLPLTADDRSSAAEWRGTSGQPAEPTAAQQPSSVYPLHATQILQFME